MKKMEVIVAEVNYKNVKRRIEKLEKKMDKCRIGSYDYNDLHKLWEFEVAKRNELFDELCLVEFGRKLA